MIDDFLHQSHFLFFNLRMPLVFCSFCVVCPADYYIPSMRHVCICLANLSDSRPFFRFLG